MEDVEDKKAGERGSSQEQHGGLEDCLTRDINREMEGKKQQPGLWLLRAGHWGH